MADLLAVPKIVRVEPGILFHLALLWLNLWSGRRASDRPEWSGDDSAPCTSACPRSARRGRSLLHLRGTRAQRVQCHPRRRPCATCGDHGGDRGSGRARLHRRGRAGQLLLQRHRRHCQAVQAAARWAAADHRVRRPRPVSRPRGLRYLRLQRRGDRACALLPVPAGRAAHRAGRLPADGEALLEVASNELVAAQEQMLLLGRKTARERLASFLLAQSRQGMPCGHVTPAVQAADDARRHRRLSRTDDRDGQPHAHAAARRGADRHRVAERAGDFRPFRAGERGGRPRAEQRRRVCARPDSNRQGVSSGGF